jgi:hypothetical protein
MLRSKLIKITLLAALTAAAVGAVPPAMARGQRAENHPRRDQGIHGQERPNHRINNELRENEVNRRQARKLHHQGRQVY